VSAVSDVLPIAAICFLVAYGLWMLIANLPRRGYARSFQGADHGGVVLYWRPGCRYCMRLRLRLRFTEVRYQEINIWRDREAAAFVRSVADGNETVPTVTVGGKALINPSLQQLVATVGSPGEDGGTVEP
jgi:mycoredoxin